MWLLNTASGELKCFARPEDVPGGYAILSHVWDSNEDTFQKVVECTVQCTMNREKLAEEQRKGVEELATSPVGLHLSDHDSTASSTSHTGIGGEDTTPGSIVFATHVDRLPHPERQRMEPHHIPIESLACPDLSQPRHGIIEMSERRNLYCIMNRLSELHVPPIITSNTNNVPVPLASSSHAAEAHQERRASTPTRPRELLSPKIRNFLVFAEENGYDWAWADTCCIDKTSSTELTEAINSMYRYYSLSDVCYAYLSDVSPDIWHKDRNSPFRTSRWHTRGWTLQELLAPKIVVFVSRGWSILGDKYDLACILRDVTGITVDVLRFEVNVMQVSMAARMSWAAKRKTTREEDQAYCLFGLFGINMPTVYGEGKNAFYRLQEELMKTSYDMSLFAWGLRTSTSISGRLSISLLPPSPDPQAILYLDCSDPDNHFFASSPSKFESCSQVIFDTGKVDMASLEVSSTWPYGNLRPTIRPITVYCHKMKSDSYGDR